MPRIVGGRWKGVNAGRGLECANRTIVSGLKSAQPVAIVGAADNALSDRGSNGNVVLAALIRNLPSIAVSLWLGGMGYFAFLVAPAAFATLDREAAGRLVSVMRSEERRVGKGR